MGKILTTLALATTLALIGCNDKTYKGVLEEKSFELNGHFGIIDRFTGIVRLLDKDNTRILIEDVGKYARNANSYGIGDTVEVSGWVVEEYRLLKNRR